MNQAGVDHGPAVAGRIAHFFHILADELAGSFRMTGIDLAHIGHEDFRINPARGRNLKTHKVCNVGDEGVAVVHLHAPGRRFGLQLADESDGSVVLLPADQDAVTRGDVSVLEVAVGPAGIRGDRNIVAHEPHLRVIALWRKPSNILLAGWLADAAEDHKSVTVVPSLAGAELEVVLPGSTRDGCASSIRRSS